MNSDNNLNKFYIIQIAIINLIAIGLIINELLKFNENFKKDETIDSSISLIRRTDFSKLNEIESRFLRFKSEVSTENNLGELLEFIELKTTNNNLSIKDTKVISATNEEIYFDLTIEGSFENITEFIKEIEEDRSIREIVNSEVSFINNQPTVKLSIRNIKL